MWTTTIARRTAAVATHTWIAIFYFFWTETLAWLQGQKAFTTNTALLIKPHAKAFAFTGIKITLTRRAHKYYLPSRYLRLGCTKSSWSYIVLLLGIDCRTTAKPPSMCLYIRDVCSYQLCWYRHLVGSVHWKIEQPNARKEVRIFVTDAITSILSVDAQIKMSFGKALWKLLRRNEIMTDKIYFRR